VYNYELVCIGFRERDRDTERQTDCDSDRDECRHTDTHTHLHTRTHTHTHTHRQTGFNGQFQLAEMYCPRTEKRLATANIATV